MEHQFNLFDDPEQNRRLVRMIKWVNSPEGKKEIEDTMKKCEQVVAELREARKIDPKSLHEPMRPIRRFY